MHRSRAVLGLVMALALPVDVARAADAVKTRAAEHEHYGRIAFDWPAPVAYDAKIDGGTALTKLRESDYGLVISDLIMQPMTGLQLLKEVRADQKLKQIPFIMITAESKTENVVAVT